MVLGGCGQARQEPWAMTGGPAIVVHDGDFEVFALRRFRTLNTNGSIEGS